jgi:hypothetical protein
VAAEETAGAVEPEAAVPDATAAEQEAVEEAAPDAAAEVRDSTAEISNGDMPEEGAL